MEKWISVKDRLPDEWVEVLTYRENNSMCIEKSEGVRCKNGRCHWTGDKVFSEEIGDFDCSEDDKVTHWQPLPDAPQGGE